MDKLLSDWDGEFVVTRREPLSGAVLVIAVHSTWLGPASGGTRATTYPSFEAASADATRLARAMTYKMAMAGLPMGGGKTVIWLPEPRAAIDDADWRRILKLDAATLNTLSGSYWTGPDVNTTQADMDVLKEDSRYVFGASPESGGSGSSAPDTAVGVFVGIKATLAACGYDSSVEGRTILVQGLGAVGKPLAEACLVEGARVLVSDVDAERVADLVAKGATALAADDAMFAPCDVYAPCAMGGTVSAEAAERLDCKAVAGSANNPLATDEAADVLSRRGILYAPDYVINSGGAIHLIGREVLAWDEETVVAHVERIGDTLSSVYERARLTGQNTDMTARRMAMEQVSDVSPGRPDTSQSGRPDA